MEECKFLFLKQFCDKMFMYLLNVLLRVVSKPTINSKIAKLVNKTGDTPFMKCNVLFSILFCISFLNLYLKFYLKEG